MPPRALTLREGKAPVRDRLLTMLFLAALLHGLIILGLTFNSASGGRDRPSDTAPCQKAQQFLRFGKKLKIAAGFDECGIVPFFE